MAGSYLNMDDGIKLLSEMLSKCGDIEKELDRFAAILEKYEEIISDNITGSAREVLSDIRSSTDAINSYINTFAGKKLVHIKNIAAIEAAGGKKVGKK